MTLVFALLAAACNAFNVVAQNRVSTSGAAQQRFWRLARFLVTNPVWLLGALALVGAFVCQALALHSGLLSIVQALLVTELVFALVLRRVWIRQRVSAAAWIWAAATGASIALFVVMAEPQGGHPMPSTASWLSAGLAFAFAASLLTVLATRGGPARRAALYASASAVTFSLEAAIIKATTNDLSSFGVLGALQRWPVYALVVGGIAGALLVQAALHVGPLSVSQPLMVSLDPFCSVILGVWLFGESFTDSPVRIVFGLLGFAAMVLSIVALSRAAPPDMRATGEAGPATPADGGSPSIG